MQKFMMIAIILFLVIFVLQQAPLIEKTSVMDSNLGIEKAEYQIKPQNVIEYLKSVPNKIFDFIEAVQKRFSGRK